MLSFREFACLVHFVHPTVTDEQVSVNQFVYPCLCTCACVRVCEGVSLQFLWRNVLALLACLLCDWECVCVYGRCLK